jgi:hypothetical protein
MLSAPESRRRAHADADSIHNYYERMVLEEIRRALPERDDPDQLADIACVALNHLPPRYIRYEVDMVFYLSPRERMEMEDKVAKAVADAIVFVDERTRHDD